MPSTAGKNKAAKGKGSSVQRSRSRNTTPSSNLAAAAISTTAEATSFLSMPVSNLVVPTNLTYDSILEKNGLGSGSIPDPKHLEALMADLETLLKLAETRANTCNAGMRQAAQVLKDRKEELCEAERLNMENAEREKMLREAEENEQKKDRKGGKLKKKKEKEEQEARERPMAVGARAMAPQDGANASELGPSRIIKTESRSGSASPQKRTKLEDGSQSTSSLSTPTHIPSPATIIATKGEEDSDDDTEMHQPPPADPQVQYQTFGPDPSKFDDPTIYDIRPILDFMSDEEKSEILQVKKFPKSDLKHLIAGTPPDKDFTNAKPSNQVSSTTFSTYLDPFLRPLTDEDTAFLKERGDRIGPFVIPRRGKKHYKEIWSEEDGVISTDPQNHDEKKLPENEARGSIDQMTDEISKTDLISPGPTVSRLLTMLRFTHHARPGDEDHTNVNGEPGGTTNQEKEDAMDIDHQTSEPAKALPPATYFPESSLPNFKGPTPKMDYAKMEDNSRNILRHLGFLPLEGQPDYDGHFYDAIAERLRLLQSELKHVSIENGARKSRLLELADEEMSRQEFTHISDDLDNQVNTAYLKRTRTLSKNKKHAKRPGGAGGGSHYVSGSGVSRPGIGDQAKILMDRRRRWSETLIPIFEGMRKGVPSKDTDVFSMEVMDKHVKAEEEAFKEAESNAR